MPNQPVRPRGKIAAKRLRQRVEPSEKRSSHLSSAGSSLGTAPKLRRLSVPATASLRPVFALTLAVLEADVPLQTGYGERAKCGHVFSTRGGNTNQTLSGRSAARSQVSMLV